MTDVRNIARTLFSLNKFELASTMLKAIGDASSEPQEIFYVFETLTSGGLNDESVYYGQKLLEMEVPDDLKLQVKIMLASAYRNTAFSEKAIKLLDEVYEVTKSNSILIEKAGCMYENNQKDEAKELLDTVDDSNLSEIDSVKKRSYLGAHQLREGNFSDGIKSVVFESNKLRNLQSGGVYYHSRSELPLEFWQGTSDCKKLIVFAEAGLGDEIINIRFLNNLKERGIDVKWYGHWHQNAAANRRVGAAEWFRSSGYDVITNLDLEVYKDYSWTYSQYLPVLLGVEENDLWTGPYMTAGTKQLTGTKKKVGIRWAGNDYPRYRNFPLKDLYNSIKDLDVDFYSLQKDSSMNELKDFPGIIDLSKQMNSFVDTAEYINSMDLVITCPTSICPAAGALDKSCITIVQISDYYVFNTKTNKTPWFGNSMDLVRQKTPRIWSDIMEDVKILAQEKLGL